MQKKKIKFKGCSTCKKLLKTTKFFKSKTQPDGFQSNCKDCNRKISRLFYQNSDKTKTKISSRIQTLKKYNLSLDDYNSILLEQDFVCAICRKPERQISNKKGGVDSLRVDHDHKDGGVRGLLCSECNFGLSKFKDSLSIMTAATLYLLKSKQIKKNEKEN